MSPTLQQFGLHTLNLEDRIALAQALWESVHQSWEDAPISPEIRDEMERRAALADADPSRGTSWSVIRAEARNRWES